MMMMMMLEVEIESVDGCRAAYHQHCPEKITRPRAY